MKNLGDALEKFLARRHKALAAAQSTAAGVQDASIPKPVETIPGAARESISDDRTARRQRRVDQYEQVMRLHRSGMNVSGIAWQTGLYRKTIRTYLDSDGFPERRERVCGDGKLTPFMAHLQQSFGEGCFNAAQLYDEACSRGFTGKYSIVKAFVATRRTKSPASPTSAEGRSESDAWYSLRGGCPGC